MRIVSEGSRLWQKTNALNSKRQAAHNDVLPVFFIKRNRIICNVIVIIGFIIGISPSSKFISIEVFIAAEAAVEQRQELFFFHRAIHPQCGAHIGVKGLGL